MNFLKIKLLVVAAIIFAASSAFADFSYQVTVDTSSLVGTSPTGYLYLDYMPGFVAPVASTATISNFTTDGTLGAQDFAYIYNGSAVSGSLGSSVVFANSNPNNDYNQAITFGSSLSFLVSLHGSTSATADASSLSLYLFGDAAGTTPLMTAYGQIANISLNNDGTASAVSFAPQADVTPTPIPAAAWLFGSGLMGLAGIRRRQNG
jgi:hypothetical protein